jgi:hyperosmotically inducible periplasmic protein
MKSKKQVNIGLNRIIFSDFYNFFKKILTIFNNGTTIAISIRFEKYHYVMQKTFSNMFLCRKQEESIMKTKLIMTTVGLAALALAGCETTSNTNNANVRVNSNTAVVTNANANVPVTNTNTRSNNPTREEYDKNRAEYEKDKGSSTIGQGANDSWLWFKTRAALLTTSDLRESTINVDAVNDVITLKGTVASAAQKAKAEEVAKGIEGVKSVKNELKVAPADSATNQMVNGGSNTRTSNANTNRK